MSHLTVSPQSPYYIDGALHFVHQSNIQLLSNINYYPQFREKLESNYTPFEIERFITDFLNALKP